MEIFQIIQIINLNQRYRENQIWEEIVENQVMRNISWKKGTPMYTFGCVVDS